LNPRSAYLRAQNTLLVAVSRSGATTETIRALQSFRENGKDMVLTLCCYPDSELAKMGNLNIMLPAGQEQSVAQTRAFSVLFLATTLLALLWVNQNIDSAQHLPEIGARLLRDYGTLAREFGQDMALERFYFLGSSVRYGLASELSLKMKEMTLSHSEPFHFLEFRHGPQSMANAHTLMVGLVSESNGKAESAVLQEMNERGARIFSMGDNDSQVAFKSNLSESLRNVLYLPIGQLMAFERSLAKGLDPDRPHNLTAVVRL
jgi:glucosamine--fructose-6-phosphate aminotransferase (isomerizing)